MQRTVVIGAVLALLSGCASPSFVGKWTAENPPPGSRSIILEINADGTFTGTSESDGPPNRIAGMWKQDSSGKTVLMQHGEKKPATAELIGKERMWIAVSEEQTIQLRRLP